MNRTTRLGSAILVAMLQLACVPASETATGVEGANEDVVRRFTAAINERDWEVFDELVADDVVRHSASTPGLEVTNREQFKTFLFQDLEAVPDVAQEIHFMFSSGDMVAIHARYLGTQTGQLGPFPPSGKAIDLPFIGLLRVEDGRIAEIWVEWNNLEMLTQLGHFPPPSAGLPAADEVADPPALSGSVRN